MFVDGIAEVYHHVKWMSAFSPLYKVTSAISVQTVSMTKVEPVISMLKIDFILSQ
jgi:hypothetical protein